MKAVFVSIFPELIKSFFSVGVINKASKESILEYDTVNPIKFLKKNERLDDASYGGGPGMLVRTEPLEEAIREAKKLTSENTKVINLSPQGKKLTQKKAKELSFEKDLIFVCGRYEGIDQRLIDSVIDEEISIGDYVVTGGELPALIVFETIVRNIKGVLGDSNSISEESFSDELLEYPQYTRPEKNNLGDVPKVLLSGNHKKIKIWRKKQSLGRTFLQRRDIFPKVLNSNDFELLEEFFSDLGYESDRIADLLENIDKK
ncbi:MAG: tRNA (guanosine(37)-N1)-methyltransferase TrmD [Gammaproteobacteria bacterium]